MCSFFFDFKANIVKDYEGLFETNFVDINEEENEELESKENKKSNSSEDYNSKWMWYSIVLDLSGGDITRFEEIFNLDVFDVLNYLSYHKETDNLRKERENQQKGRR